MARVASLLRDRVKQCLQNMWKCGCLEGIHVYAMEVSNIQGKDNTGGYNKIIGYRRGKKESCYVDTNNVYTISRMYGYQIVLLDGYDRPKMKCHGTAKNCHSTGTHFAAINCCKYIFTIGNSKISEVF